MEGFKEFIKKQGVVGFAVAFAIGGALVQFVQDLITGVVNPLIGAILGSEDALDGLSVEVGGIEMVYGAAIGSFIAFLATALVVYLLVKMTGADAWDAEE